MFFSYTFEKILKMPQQQDLDEKLPQLIQQLETHALKFKLSLQYKENSELWAFKIQDLLVQPKE